MLMIHQGQFFTTQSIKWNICEMPVLFRHVSGFYVVGIELCFDAVLNGTVASSQEPGLTLDGCANESGGVVMNEWRYGDASGAQVVGLTPSAPPLLPLPLWVPGGPWWPLKRN